jgi:anti-sigma B factor antagonist
MDFKTTQDKGRGCIEVIGDIDERGAELFKAKLKELQQLDEVAIDFSGVKYVGSSGIGKLLLFYKNVGVHGGKISVTHLQPDLFRLFKELKLDTIFSITAK